MKPLTVETIRATALLEEPTGVSDVLDILSYAGPYEARMLGYAWAALAYRTIMSLLPSFSNMKTYNERRRAVERVVKDRGLENKVTPAEIDEIVDLGSRLLDARSGVRKKSWSDLHYATRRDILVQQNHRCTVCGVPLDLGTSGLDNSPELDHIFPFAMRGNMESNTRVICKRCNMAKHDHLTYLTVGRLAVGDTIKEENINMNQLLYWAVELSRSKCQSSGCETTSLVDRLYIMKQASLLPWNIDNVTVCCSKCSLGATRYPEAE